MQNDFILRANHARRCVNAVPKQAADKYLTAVKGLPAEIRLIGFGQALATLLAKGEQGDRLLYDHIEEWLQTHNIYAKATAPSLLNSIISGNNAQYRRAVAEADAYLAILKRLAEAFLTPAKREAEPRREAAE